mgnify:CR=1 FL=1
MSKVRRLSEGTINRIAAGEVVERPASAVKELVENAIDAGSSQIDIVVVSGGRDLIRVSDDGCGMSPDDLLTAIERHATSKLKQDETGREDLHDIDTLGFRGEALPSIGAVARLSITTRDETADTASKLTVEGGKLGAIEPVAGPEGTRIEVYRPRPVDERSAGLQPHARCFLQQLSYSDVRRFLLLRSKKKQAHDSDVNRTLPDPQTLHTL